MNDAVMAEVAGLIMMSNTSKIGPKPDVITENGTYYARSDSLDGYSSVVVNVKEKKKVYTSAEEAQSDLDEIVVTPQTTEKRTGIPVTFHASATNEPSQYAYYGFTTSVQVGYVNSETGEWVSSGGMLYGQGIKNFKVVKYFFADEGWVDESGHWNSAGWYGKCSYVRHDFWEDVDVEVTENFWFAGVDTFGEDMEYILDSPTITT